MRELKVCVDGTPLLLRSAGVKTYVWHWTEALRRTAGSHQFSRFPYLDRCGLFDHERSMLPRLSTYLRLGVLHMANMTRGLSAKWSTSDCDVFHASHQLQHPPRGPKLTSTVYDMTCWLVPEMHSAANVRASKQFAERVFRRADGLIAISRQTKDDAVRILGLDPDKIRVVYPGVADAYFTVTPEEGAAAARQYSLDRPFALFVGTIEPRKNLDVLLDAWGVLPKDFELVVVGAPGWGDDSALRRLRSRPEGVRYLGYVPEEHLPGLTRAASFFVYPSRYEGFGLPVAQAMAAGVPVLTSNVSSLPEVAGGGGLLVDGNSPSEVAAAVHRLFLSPDLRRELGEAGRIRAQEFHWDLAARRSWDFFESVALQ